MKKITEFWIEKSWGGSIDNAVIEDVEIIIKEIIQIDLEYATFWIGHINEEYVIEIRKNLIFVFIYGENQDKEVKCQLHNWAEVENFLNMYFRNEFLNLKNEITLYLT